MAAAYAIPGGIAENADLQARLQPGNYLLVIDSKIPPQTLDLEFIEWLVSCQIPFALIFTKADKTKPSPLKKNISAFLNALAERCDGTPSIFTCSSRLQTGRLEILGYIKKVLALRG